MVSRDMLRDTASTLAYLWLGPHPMDRCGVERIIRSHSEPLRPILCTHIMRYLEHRGHHEAAVAFEAMLFDIAGVPEDV